MTVIGWDQAIEDAHDDMKDKLVELVLSGVIYRSERDVWYQRVKHRDVMYGYFPPLPFAQGELLDELLVEDRIYEDGKRDLTGLHRIIVT
jgi:hypothetical protein